MFDVFSLRSRQIVFAARFAAGERGADIIDVDDLLVGLVLEDQGLLTDVLSRLHGEPIAFAGSAESHTPFFPQKTAQDLLTRMQKHLPRSRPTSPTTSASVSPALRRVFDSAKAFQSRLQGNHIEPLHLLAAILTEGSSEGAASLQGCGLTCEKVLRALDGPADN